MNQSVHSRVRLQLTGLNYDGLPDGVALELIGLVRRWQNSMKAGKWTL